MVLLLNRTKIGTEIEASAEALQRSLVRRFAAAADAVQRLRPEAVAASAFEGAAGGGPTRDSSTGGSLSSDAVLIRPPSSVASLRSAGDSGNTSPEISPPKGALGAQGGGAGSDDAMQVDSGGLPTLSATTAVEVPPDLLTSLGIGFQFAVQGLRTVEPVRLRERLLQMLPQMFKLQELAGKSA